MFAFKFLDVGATYRLQKEELDRAWAEIHDGGLYIGGGAVQEFEESFARYCGAAHCVGTGNGLDAITIALRAFGIGPGDEVIVPAHTFIATWLAVSQVGATPVPVDADPETMNMDRGEVVRAISSKTRAIVPVHLYGAPVPCSGLMALAEEAGIVLIEDAAQAHGARDQGRPVGSLGHAAAFSFYPAKNLGAFGDGGAIVMRDAEIAQRARRLGNYGMSRKYEHEVAGVNSRLDALQAKVLSVKLARLDYWNERRREIAKVYSAVLAEAPELVLPKLSEEVQSSWHLYVVRLGRRDALRRLLAERGVETGLHYPIANHRSGTYRGDFGNRRFPVTERICETCLSLPIGPHLSLDDAHVIAGIVRDAVRAI